MLRKKILITILTIVIIGTSALVLGCTSSVPSPTAAPTDAPGGSSDTLSGSITVAGSSSVGPSIEGYIKPAFEAIHNGVKVNVLISDSGTGIKSTATGTSDIGMSSRALKPEDGADLKSTVIAYDGIAVIANNANSITNLSKQQIVDIFAGKITNWKEVGGPDQKIVLVNRTKASGTRATFKKYALGGAEEASGIEEDASGTVRKIIKETPGAIGYLALSYLDGSVKEISLDGVAPTKDNIVAGKYPVWAYEHIYTKGTPSGAVDAFLNYLMTDDVQKTIVPQLGYIPATEMKIARDASGNVKDK
jgi:phosphate transport system substrate-binding protein